MTLVKIDNNATDGNGNHVWHSTEQYATHPECEDCRSIAEFEANPPQHGPRPTVFTEADMCDGPDALLEAMRREFHGYHIGRLAYSPDFLDDARLAIATQDVTHARKGFDYAQAGDAVLVKPARHDYGDPRLNGCVSVWTPRTRGMVLMRPEMVRLVVAVEDLRIGSPEWEAAFAAKRAEQYPDEV